jgi:hydrogenase maturation protease
MTKMLVAGVGNIFLGDDGFGAEVARRLAEEDLPAWVQVADYGISGMHLAYDLAAEGCDTAILVDTAQRGDPPGTLTVIDAGRTRQRAPAGGALDGSRLFDAHGMQPDVVLGVLDMLGAGSARVLVVGCEPASLDYGMELSEPVAGAVEEAVQVVKRLIAGAREGFGRDGSAVADAADATARPSVAVKE